VQADVASNCSSSDEDDESETKDSSGTSQKAENSIISSGIDETLPQNGSEGLQKIDSLVPSAMPVPLRPPMISASSNMPTEAGNMSNLLINSSNRNSATSLDSGRGSAYATSSEGLKLSLINHTVEQIEGITPVVQQPPHPSEVGDNGFNINRCPPSGKAEPTLERKNSSFSKEKLYDSTPLP
ncbi:hypothetical protein ACTXT7_007734, partial [Hymenolepis weldensis]